LKNFFCHPREIGDPDKRETNKEILKGEGLKCVSVRNIAERAGYSYATLYNYFKDVKDLVFECVQDFQEECEAFIHAEADNTPPGLEKIAAVAEAYLKYFVHYPGIFELFYLEKTTDLGSKQSTSEKISTFPDRLLASDWEHCIRNKIVTAEEVTIIKQTLNTVITGLLVLYLNRRFPPSYQEFILSVKTQLHHVLQP
jgi:AcrR family transcriptional regulator